MCCRYTVKFGFVGPCDACLRSWDPEYREAFKEGIEAAALALAIRAAEFDVLLENYPNSSLVDSWKDSRYRLKDTGYELLDSLEEK